MANIKQRWANIKLREYIVRMADARTLASDHPDCIDTRNAADRARSDCERAALDFEIEYERDNIVRVIV